MDAPIIDLNEYRKKKEEGQRYMEYLDDEIMRISTEYLINEIRDELGQERMRLEFVYTTDTGLTGHDFDEEE